MMVIKNWKWFQFLILKNAEIRKYDFDERGVPSYIDNDSDWWYKRRTCAGMNHYLITQRISRDEAFDEPIGRKKKSVF